MKLPGLIKICITYVRFMNQDKLKGVKQGIVGENIGILEISEQKWTGMGEFHSGDHCIYYCGQKSIGRNGVALIDSKRVQNKVLGCNLKKDRVISVHFQGKPFNNTVIHAYVRNTNVKEAEFEWSYEDL